MMKKIFKNKKASVGLIILVAFGLIAIFGPFFSTDDPILAGSVPTGRMPVGVVMAFPGWYNSFTGDKAYTNNIYVTPDPAFSDPSKLSLWTNVTTNSGINVSYNSTTGFGDKGCIEMAFTEEGNATLSIQFDYPYDIPPRMFSAEWSYRIEAQNQSVQPANFTIFTDFSYNTSRATRSFPASGPLVAKAVTSDWNPVPWYDTSSVAAALKNQYPLDPASVIFTRLGKYSFDITVQFLGNTTASGNPKFFLDNVNLVVFGNSFGLLGTDDKARDLFTQLVIGTRISFIIGMVSAVLSVGIGLIVGLVAGYVGGATDEVLMRFNDMLLVIPTLPLLIVLVFVLGQSMLNIIIVVGFLGWMGFARTVRSSVLSLKERSFIEAVKSAGGGRFYIIRKHIIPNVFPLIYITLAMTVPGAIVSEAALSWLGLGPLDVMSWGRILHEFETSGNTATGAFTFWYWTIPPGICIALLSLSFVLIGYALDEILNPRLRER